jgi:hypothetical protein
MLPGGVAMQALGQSHYVLSEISCSAVWQTLIVPYQAWAVLVVALWLSTGLLRPGDAVAPNRGQNLRRL